MINREIGRVTAAAGVLLLVAAAAHAQGGITKEKQGKGGSVVQGAAGTDGSTGDSGLQHCDKPMGAIDPQAVRRSSPPVVRRTAENRGCRPPRPPR